MGRTRLLLVVAATVGTAAAVAVSGLIAFVGIIVPHTIRLLAGTSYRGLLPLSFVVGAGFLVLADVIARTALSPAELPIGVVTAFFGGAVLRARSAHDAGWPLVSAIAHPRASASPSAGASSCATSTCDVPSGQWVGLIGPNGAGKTTLLRAVAGLVSYEGTVTLHGVPAHELSRRDRAPRARGRPPGARDAAVADGRASTSCSAGRRTSGRSGANRRTTARRQQQCSSDSTCSGSASAPSARSAVASASASSSPGRSSQDASIVLLDEPTAALDIGHQQQALELLDTLRAESALTLVAAMHDLTLAAQYAERMILLDEGCVVADGAPEDVLTEISIARHYDAADPGRPRGRPRGRRALASPRLR